MVLKNESEVIIIYLLYVLAILYIIIAGLFLYLFLAFQKSSYKQVSQNNFLKAFFNKGYWGEYKIFADLERASSYHKLLTNLYIPRTDGTTTEIDLLFINNKGIFVIESKNYSGWIFGDEKQKFWTQTFQTKKKYRFFNPVWQNNAHINALKEVLVPSYSEVLQSIIIFSNQCELKKITLYSDHVTIIQRKQLKGKMNSIQKEKSNCLEKEQIDSIANSLKKYTHPSEQLKQKHNQIISMK